MTLTDVTCRSTRPGSKRRKLSDGEGLQLWIAPKGPRHWRFIYRYDGKQKTLCLGAYPKLGLADARAERDRARALLREGRDPLIERARTELAEVERQHSEETFRNIAREFVAKCQREGYAEVTLWKKQWLLDMAMPYIGDFLVRETRPIHVLQVLQKVEAKGQYETARRLRSTIGSVFRFAIATARCDLDPTVSLRGAIATPKVKSHAAITDPEGFGALLRAIDGFGGQPQTVAGLKLLALLFPRPGELRLSKWPEYDFKRCVWTIPAERMKMRVEHKVPLAPQAIAILNQLREFSGHKEYVFPGLEGSSEKSLCENVFNQALRRMGYEHDEMTSHGFRSSASSLLNDSDIWNPDAIERQLAHAEANLVRRIYARNAHWKLRVQMMAWWADYLDELRTTATSKKMVA